MNQMSIVHIVSGNNAINQLLADTVRVVLVPVTERTIESAVECSWCGTYGPGISELLPDSILQLIDKKPKQHTINTPRNVTQSLKIFVVASKYVEGKEDPVKTMYFEVQYENMN